MSQINISNLSFGYDGSYDNIFENVSFDIDTDWKLGLIGSNGCGKTTFLKLLLKEYEYSGKITSSVQFDYFPFEIPDNSINTIDIVENIYPDFEFWKIQKELSLLMVDSDILYRPFYTLSNGEQSKVLLSTLFLKENNFLLIDEPTNHLDTKTRQVLSDYLKTKKGFILVSHDRAFMDNCVDHILSINNTDIDIQSGNFSSWWSNKIDRDNYEIAKNKKLKGEIKSLQESARRTSSWSDKIEKSKNGTGCADRGFLGHKSAKMMKRSKSIESRRQNLIDEKSSLLKNIQKAENLKLTSADYHKERLAEIRNVSIFYGEKLVCSDISFTVNKGERISLIGKNGSGKSSIIKLILGEDISFTGACEVASGLKISYVCQDTSFLSGSLDEFILENGIDEVLFKTILRKLNFSRTQFEKNIEDFSGGQKKKVLIAKSLCEKAHLYIWDEPLNFIDVLSRMQIEQLIKEYSPTMIFVEHDISFVDDIATKKIYL